MQELNAKTATGIRYLIRCKVRNLLFKCAIGFRSR